MPQSTDITITMHRASSREDSYFFRVSHTEITSEDRQPWYQDFSIRDSSGNPTSLGRSMGIKCCDKPLTPDSSKWKSVQEYLHRLAWKHAGELAHRNRVAIIDNTPYANN